MTPTLRRFWKYWLLAAVVMALFVRLGVWQLHRKAEKELVCKPCKLAYPIRDDIPVMLEDEARQLNEDAQ